jgi:hypothetical protein
MSIKDSAPNNLIVYHHVAQLDGKKQGINYKKYAFLLQNCQGLLVPQSDQNKHPPEITGSYTA